MDARDPVIQPNGIRVRNKMHVVAAVRDLPVGARKTLTVKGRPIVVFNVHGAFFGLLDRHFTFLAASARVTRRTWRTPAHVYCVEREGCWLSRSVNS